MTKNMTNNQEDLYRKIAERCREKIEEFENTEVHCALIGQSGSGKSSLINAIAGEKIANVGVVETTSEPRPFKHQGIMFTDLPGCGTAKYPKAQYRTKSLKN
jgi:predicted GTPase